MEKKFKLNAPVRMAYAITSENNTNYHMNLTFEHDFMTEFAHCSLFNPIIPEDTERKIPGHCGYDFDFVAVDADSAEYTALKIIQHIIGHIMNKLVRIINPQGHNVGISTDSSLLLAKELPVHLKDYCVDISARHDRTILGFPLLPHNLVLNIRIPVEPCFEMNANERFDIELLIVCGIPVNTQYSGVLTACSAIKALKKHMTDTLSYIGDRMDDIFVG